MDFRLPPVKRCIAAALFDQFIVRPILHQPATIDRDDPMASAHGRKAVRDDEYGTPLGDALHIILNDALALIVQRTGGLVKDQNAGIGHQGPADRDSLPLPPSKPAAPLS